MSRLKFQSGDCFYCKQGYSSRCSECQLYGTTALDGAQAEYVGTSMARFKSEADVREVRVPLADSTVVKAPKDVGDSSLVLMADVFPTGYFAAHNAFKDLTREQIAEATVVLIGCG